MVERRVTRSLSNELQARAVIVNSTQAQAQAQAQTPTQDQAEAKFQCSRGSHSNTDQADSFSFEKLPYCRMTSEEIFLSTVVDDAVTHSNLSMDGLGLSNLPTAASRRNSEDLFSTWISSQEGLGAASPYQTRQVTRRISNEIMAVPQQTGGSQQQLNNCEPHGLYSNSLFANDMFGDQSRPRFAGAERPSAAPEHASLQELSWFQQSQPMTRSRSAELRRMYAAMQGLPSLPSADTLQRLATQGTHGLNQAVASLGAFARGLANGRAQQSSKAIQHPQLCNRGPSFASGNSISNMVSMLKGSLEHKRLNEMSKHIQHTTAGDSSSCPTVHGWFEPSQTFSVPSGNTSTDIEMQNGGQLNFRGTTSSSHLPSTMLMNAVSPGESSGGAPTLSAGMALSDGPSNSGTVSTQHDALQRSVHRGRTVDQPSKRRNYGGTIQSPRSHRSGDGTFEGFPNTSLGKRPEQLMRAGSLNSSGRSGHGDSNNPTKMRRVERREKMLEAKGRPVLPSDLQVAIKRCEALEKEVRSLKLTVSFMNRKDSEQTKQIEELEKENQELQQETEGLLKEVEKLSSGQYYR